MRRLLAILVLLLAAPAAPAAELEMVGSYSGEGAAELEVAGDYAFLVGGRAEIVSIADPRDPKTVATIDCGSATDLALDPAAQIMVVGSDSGDGCVGGMGGISVWDIRNPAKPELLS